MKNFLLFAAALFLLASMPALAQPPVALCQNITTAGVTTCQVVSASNPLQITGAGGGSVSVTAGSSNIVINPTPGTGTFTVDTGASPTFATSVTTPLVIGGTGAASTLTLESTSGAGTTDAILFKTASQSEKMRIISNGNVGIGSTIPQAPLEIDKSGGGVMLILNPLSSNVFADINTNNATGGLRLYGGTTYANGPAFQIWPTASSFQGMYFDAGSSAGADIFFRSTAGVTPVTGMIIKQGTARVGIGGVTAPTNVLDVNAGMVIGSSYAGVNTAPTNGLLVQGNVGIGTTTIQNSAALQVNGTIESGVSGSTLGSVLLAGNTGGFITIKSQAAAGTYNFNLPITAGSSGQAMLSGGGSSTAMTWGTVATGSGGTPTCGTGCASVTAGSTDLRGSMVSGSSVSAVTLNFSGTLTSAPFCTISDSNTSATADISSISTSALTVSLASALTSVTIYWNCPL